MGVDSKVDRVAGARRDTVEIMVNGEAFEIHRGRQSVADIKELAGVPKADQLEQVIDGQLVPLDDGAAVTIKGDEQFVSHPRDSAAA